MGRQASGGFPQRGNSASCRSVVIGCCRHRQARLELWFVGPVFMGTASFGGCLARVYVRALVNGDGWQFAYFDVMVDSLAGDT